MVAEGVPIEADLLSEVVLRCQVYLDIEELGFNDINEFYDKEEDEE